MTTKKERPPQFTTPRVTFEYPRLTEPDAKFNDKNPQFSVRFKADPSDPVIAKIIQLLDAASVTQEQELRKQIAANKSLTPPKRKEALEGIKVYKGYEEDYDDQDQPTGLLRFKASTGSVFKDKAGKTIKRKVTIVDAKKTDITKRAPKIGSGSQGKLIVTVGSGVSAGSVYAKLYLSAVQLLKLVEPGSGAANAFEEEDGYDGDDLGAQDEADTEAAGASGGDEDEEL